MSLKIEGLSVDLGGRKILREINLEVEEGESVLIGGPSGSGKSTLLRASVGVIPEKIPGKVSGKVLPSPLKNFSFYVTQEPWFSIITPYVWSEVLSFSKIKWEEMKMILEEFGLSGKEYQSTYTLSSGEMQRIGFIGAVLSERKHLLLDEPAAHLDKKNREMVIRGVKEAKRRGISFIIVDHNLKEWKGTCDRVFILRGGRLLEGSFEEYDDILEKYSELSPPDPKEGMVSEIKVEEFSYQKGRILIRDLEFEVRRGEVVWIKGPSGSGKSTLLRIIAKGINTGGIRIKRPKKTTYIPDNPLLFFSNPRPKYEVKREILEEFGIGHLYDSPIMKLSVGERRRVAIASAVSRGSDLVLLDEPTIGIDPYSKLPVLRSIVRAAEKGSSFIIASHDEEISRISNEVIELGRGNF